MTENLVELDDLDLGLPLPRVGPGRSAMPLEAEFVRELTPADLAMPASKVTKPPEIKRLRDSHHALARCLSSGMKEHEAALVTGYSLSRISILKADPQFNELLELYRESAFDVVAALRVRMADMGHEAMTELMDRLQTKPDDFSPGLLNEIIKTMGDRLGLAPKTGGTANVNINVDLTDRMQAARDRVRAIQAPKTIEHE